MVKLYHISITCRIIYITHCSIVAFVYNFVSHEGILEQNISSLLFR
jgi:hypothetical protein